MSYKDDSNAFGDGDIAIVGMAVHLPGAENIEDFWANLDNGVESIRKLSEKQLLNAGEPLHRIKNPNYVPAAATLDNFEMFDGEFFGLSPKESAIMDPQHRQFLECSWEAMENAGHPPESIDGPVGVFAGCGMGSYFYFNICSNRELVNDVGMFLLRHTGNDKDFLSTRVSHVFDLRGPSVNIQTACSTSLVAVHEARKSLLAGECDLALAGGVTIELPQGRGYVFKENEILSPDGHCHAFDHRAKGTVFGSGAGVVVLRRLTDALKDGDHIQAVIKGSAINNDGADKAGYLAPSVNGQSTAILRALQEADVDASTIDYVECHGTGTYLGDPIEIAALTDAFRKDTNEKGYCRVGSVKTNIGHLDTAAGVVSLIKSSLAIKHGQIPASLGFEKPNPSIDFDNSPFRVNAQLTDWPQTDSPRRAGINSLGVGGTNAHVVIEEAPVRLDSEESDWPFHLLCVSGHSKAALSANTDALAAFLRKSPDVPLADIAHSLKSGRKAQDMRRVVVAETHDQAADLLENTTANRCFTHETLGNRPEIVFMFPGGGAQHPNMARDLYETEPAFAEWMDRGLNHLQAQLDYDIRAIWQPPAGQEKQAAERLKQPSVQLPLIMIVEYALAQLWLSWGVKPSICVGHSMGENTAACLAGVLSFEDCIDLVLTRGRLFDRVPSGGMVSIAASLAEIDDLIDGNLDVASINAEALVAVSGPKAELTALCERLESRNIDHQIIPIDIAAHSRMLDPILTEYRAFLASIELSAPTLPFLSNRTGIEISAQEASNPDYWVDQLRQTVLFHECMSTLADRKGRIFLEIGPGRALSSLASMNSKISPNQVISSLRHPDDDVADDVYFLSVIGRLWACGYDADWGQIWGEARRNRVPLPTYAFQRKSYFVERAASQVSARAPSLMRSDDPQNWGWAPSWKKRYADCPVDWEKHLKTQPKNWLFFMDEANLAEPVVSRLEAAGHKVTRVFSADSFEKTADGHYRLPADQGQGCYDLLARALADEECLPDTIAHFWLLTAEETCRAGGTFFDRNMDHGFYSLMFLYKALAGAMDGRDTNLLCFTNGAAQVSEEALRWAEKTTVLGPIGVIPREMPNWTCKWIDLDGPVGSLSARPSKSRKEAFGLDPEAILQELVSASGDGKVAWRDGVRFVQSVALQPLPDAAENHSKGGTYLITGGLGGIGQTIAADLLKDKAANVVLVGRTKLEQRHQWDDILERVNPTSKEARGMRALMSLQGLDGTVCYFDGDVCDVNRLREIVSEVENRFGPITSVIHAAGANDDMPILRKTPEAVDRVFQPKINGLRAIDAVFPDGAVDRLVLFSSSSTATNPAGQIDYVAANEYLNGFAASRANGRTKTVAVNWGVWSDTGMAVEAIREHADQPTAVTQPLLDTVHFDANGKQVFSASRSGQKEWVFNEHRTKAGSMLLPGTGYIELIAEALSEQGVVPGYEIRDLHFFRPLAASKKAETAYRVSLENRDGEIRFEARTEVEAGDVTGTVLNAQACIVPLEKEQTHSRIDLDAISRTFSSYVFASANRPLRAPQEANLNFGPRWCVLRTVATDDGIGYAELNLPQRFAGDVEAGYLLHPALLDQATGWALDLAPQYDPAHVWVPVSYGAIRVHGSLPQKVVSIVKLNKPDQSASDFVSFDVQICREDGTIILEVFDFQMKKLEAENTFALDADISESEIDPDAQTADAKRILTEAELRLRHNITQGINADEGSDALNRALSLNTPQIYVSSLDLTDLIEQTNQADQPDETTVSEFERPELDTDFAAPDTATEMELAAIWEKLLGVKNIGRNDSFFDLGGHSLLAVRLFAQIKARFDVQFPISVLFEAPSIQECAALIEEKTTVAAVGDESSENNEAAEQPRFRHLIPLHPGSGDAKTPLFIVAGMFGNVLNLRQLGLLVGRERAVFGLQARGLLDHEEPHKTIPEAAKDYLRELKQVQPEGPYFLAGFSGGGITAYEMAQQLKEAGDEVSVLALLDTPLPVRPRLSNRDKALIKLQEFKRKGPGYLVEWFRNRMAWEVQKRQGNISDTSDEGQFNNDKIESAFRSAVACYDLKAWDGDIILFRPPLDQHWKLPADQWVSREREYVFADNQWTRWAPNLQVIEVPGDHDSMVLVPNVAVLANHLRAAIDETANTSEASARFTYRWDMQQAAE